MAKASWLDWGGEDWRQDGEDGEDGEEEGDCRHYWMRYCGV